MSIILVALCARMKACKRYIRVRSNKIVQVWSSRWFSARRLPLIKLVAH